MFIWFYLNNIIKHLGVTFEIYRYGVEGMSTKSRKVVLLDDDGNIINEVVYEPEDIVKSVEITQEVDEPIFKDLIYFLGDDLDVFIPYNEGEGFIVQHPSPNFLNVNYSDQINESKLRDSVIGKKYSEIFPVYAEVGFLDVYRQVYKENKTTVVKSLIFEDGLIIRSFVHKVGLLNDCIYVQSKNSAILDYDNEYKVFDYSITPLFILQRGNVVLINNAFKKLLKYIGTTEVNFFKNFNYKLIFEKYKEMYNNLISGKVNQFDFYEEFENNKGKIFYLNINVTPKTFNNDSALMVSVTDNTKQKEAEVKAIFLQENMDIIQNFSKTAFSICSRKNESEWLWTQEIYSILEIEPHAEDNHFNLLKKYIVHEDKDAFDDVFNSLSIKNPKIKSNLRVKTGKGNDKYITVYMHANFKGDKLKNISLFIQDITDMVEAQKEAFSLQYSLNTIQDISKIVICRYENNEYFWTDEIYSILEIEEADCEVKSDLVMEHCIPEDQEKLMAKFANVSNENPIIYLTVRVLTGKGNIKYLRVQAYLSFDENDEMSFVGFIQDITDYMVHELQLKKSVSDKEVLLKEVHHRIKNNLQIILSLINLELRFSDNDYEKALKETRTRINSIALIHEKIYASADLAHVNLKEYITSAVGTIFDVYDLPHVDLVYDLENVEVNIETAIPIGLILNELVNNSVKYAFPNNRSGKITITLERDKFDVYLTIADDGVGIPDDVDILNSPSLGLTVVNNLIEQLDGKITLLNSPGTAIQIMFKIVDVF